MAYNMIQLKEIMEKRNGNDRVRYLFDVVKTGNVGMATFAFLLESHIELHKKERTAQLHKQFLRFHGITEEDN